MKCVYSAGVLAALTKELKFTDPYIMIGSSGSISLAYYVSKQYDSFENIWTNLLTSKQFLSKQRPFKIMDIDYMVDTVFKKQDRLQTEEILKSKIKLFFNVTNYETGQSEYLSGNGGNDIFEIMRATTAIPLIYNKPVQINNQKYIDGQITSSIGRNVEKAISEGANKIIIIHYGDINASSIVGKIFWKICSLFSNLPVRKSINEYINGKHDIALPVSIPIYTIKPKSSLPIGLMDNNKDRLIKSFRMGYEDVVNDINLISFISEKK